MSDPFTPASAALAPVPSPILTPLPVLTPASGPVVSSGDAPTPRVVADSVVDSAPAVTPDIPATLVSAPTAQRLPDRPRQRADEPCKDWLG